MKIYVHKEKMTGYQTNCLDEYKYLFHEVEVDELPDLETMMFDDITLTFVPKPDSELLEMAKVEKMTELNKAFEEYMARLRYGVPPSEVASWDQQHIEAKKHLYDGDKDTPLLTDMALARGVDLTWLAERVIIKAGMFASPSGSIIGTRQKHEDQIVAATTQEELEAITFEF